MTKREKICLAILFLLLFTITFYVCFVTWGLRGVQLAFSIINAIVNLFVMGVAINALVEIKRSQTGDRK